MLIDHPPQRDTRVQIAIIEKGRLLLLKHWAIQKDYYFWGLPGGGCEAGETEETAATREALEETGLTVQLLPVKFTAKPLNTESIYRRKVTFLAVPIAGEARVGYDPEPEMTRFYQLVDIKWQDFFDDEGLDEVTLYDLKPLREYVSRRGLPSIANFSDHSINL